MKKSKAARINFREVCVWVCVCVCVCVWNKIHFRDFEQEISGAVMIREMWTYMRCENCCESYAL